MRGWGGKSSARLEGFSEPSFAEGVEFEFSKQVSQGLFVGGLEGQFVEGMGKGNVSVDGDESFGEEGLFFELNDVFALFPFEFLGVVQEVFNGSVLLNEFLGGFFANAWNTWDVVRGVSPKSEDVANLVDCLNAPLFENFTNAENFGV